MKWTSDPPSEEGWYWYTNKYNNYPRILEIRKDGPFGLSVVEDDERTYETLDWYTRKENNTKWAGPIDPPPEGE